MPSGSQHRIQEHKDSILSGEKIVSGENILYNDLMADEVKPVQPIVTPGVPASDAPAPEKTEAPQPIKEELKTEPVPQKNEEPEQPKQVPAEEPKSVMDMWGDLRHSPHFLAVADYFGIDSRDYSLMADKIDSVIRWAEVETQSKNVDDMLLKISKTARSLQSPGMGEKRINILYRYIKLARQRQEVDKAMKVYEKRIA